MTRSNEATAATGFGGGGCGGWGNGKQSRDGSSNKQQIEYQQDPSDLDRDERHGPEETAVWGQPGFALGLLSATTVARRRKRGDRLCSRLGRGREAEPNQQWTSNKQQSRLAHQTDESSQVSRGEPQACSARFGWPRVFVLQMKERGEARCDGAHSTGEQEKSPAT